MTFALVTAIVVVVVVGAVLIDRRDARERLERGQLLDRIERPGTVVSTPVTGPDPEHISFEEQEIRDLLATD